MLQNFPQAAKITFSLHWRLGLLRLFVAGGALALLLDWPLAAGGRSNGRTTPLPAAPLVQLDRLGLHGCAAGRRRRRSGGGAGLGSGTRALR